MHALDRPSLLVASGSNGRLTHLARPRNQLESVGHGGVAAPGRGNWQSALRSVAAAQQFKKATTPLLRFAPSIGTSISQEVELLTEGKVLRRELSTCDEEYEAMLERGRIELEKALIECKRIGEIETKLRLGCEQAAMIAAAIAPEVDEERRMRIAAEGARDAAVAEAAGAKAEASRLVDSESKLRAKNAEMELARPILISASREAAERADLAEAALAASGREAEGVKLDLEARLSEAEARVAELQKELIDSSARAEEELEAAIASAESNATVRVAAAEARAQADARERVAVAEAACEQRTLSAIAAAQADARKEIEGAKASMKAQLDAEKADLQSQQSLLQTNADRAVRELDRGMQAAWQIAEEAEAGRQAALERVATLEAALRVALEDDEDDPPEPTPPS